MAISERRKGGKIIDLGMQLGDHTVAMIVTITPEEKDSEKSGIQIQLFPTRGERYLPPQYPTDFVLKSRENTPVHSIERSR